MADRRMGNSLFTPLGIVLSAAQPFLTCGSTYRLRTDEARKAMLDSLIISRLRLPMLRLHIVGQGASTAFAHYTATKSMFSAKVNRTRGRPASAPERSPMLHGDSTQCGDTIALAR